jgi:hypothetical protein
MRQRSGHTGTRQTCSVEQRENAIERETDTMSKRPYSDEGGEEEESRDSQITLSWHIHRALYTTH